MPSRDLQAEARALYTEHRETVHAAVAVGAFLLVVLLLSGWFGVEVLVLGNTLVWLVIIGLVLWLLYRFVTAVERIAAAQERIASARDHEVVENGAPAESSSRDGVDDEFPADGDEFPPGVGGSDDGDR